MSTPAKKYTKILAIDGGGLRGVIPAMLLDEIERRTEKPIHDMFDLIAGTSTGGLLATYLASPQRAKAKATKGSCAPSLASFYEKNKDRIFRSCKARIPIVKHVFLKYRSSGLKNVLRSSLSNDQLKCTKPDILVTAYDIRRGKPCHFSTMEARKSERCNYYLRDVALATSAAPGAFPPAMIRPVAGSKCTEHFVDGAVFAPDPSLRAYAEVLQETKPECIIVVSLGTGERRVTFNTVKAQCWGSLGWVANGVTSLLLDNAGDVVERNMKRVTCTTKSLYYRFDVCLGKDLNKVSEHDPANRYFKMYKKHAKSMMCDKMDSINELCCILKRYSRAID